ncbi:MAG TPA: hypothetical protein V6D27_02955 [Vampirovibrionales bacterium]
MTYWVKFIYDRETYVVDLARIGAFCRSPNGKIAFWLPQSRTPVVIHPQSNTEAYQTVVNFINKTVQYSLGSHWVKIHYEREEYDVDLNRISSFCCAPGNGKISFFLPDSGMRIIIHPQSNPDDYQKVVDYIEQTTGHDLTG